MIKVYKFILLENVLPMFKLFYGSTHSPAKLINLNSLVFCSHYRNVEIVYYVLNLHHGLSLMDRSPFPSGNTE